MIPNRFTSVPQGLQHFQRDYRGSHMHLKGFQICLRVDSEEDGTAKAFVASQENRTRVLVDSMSVPRGSIISWIALETALNSSGTYTSITSQRLPRTAMNPQEPL